MNEDGGHAPRLVYQIIEDDGEWNDEASLQELRDVLSVAQSAFDPEYQPDEPADPIDPGRSMKWADTIDPVSGAYREDALHLLGDSLAESIIGTIHDGFVMERRADRVAAIIYELRQDRERLTRVLAVLARRSHGVSQAVRSAAQVVENRCDD